MHNIKIRGLILLQVLSFVIICIISISQNSYAESCQCAPVECGECEVLTGTTFYTSKCDGGRTKSCQKPTCQLRQTKECQPQKAHNSESKESLADTKPILVEAKKIVGVFAIVRGEVHILSRGVESKAKVGTKVLEKDVVTTADASVAKIIMIDKNILHLAENSELKVKGYETAEQKGYSSATIDLMYGKVRSQVVTKPKYVDKPVFKIRTPGAVAGVRGTDFIVTHVKGGDITKVETLRGVVELGGHNREEKALIKKGSYASYVVVASNTPRTISDDDIGSFIHKGFITPVYQMTMEKMEKLDIETEYREDGSDRILAKANASQSICNKPSGELNQCAWTCVNNPAGETRCRTELPNVKCIRTRCDANGRWSGEERLPAKYGEHCQSEVTVAPCDY